MHVFAGFAAMAQCRIKGQAIVRDERLDDISPGPRFFHRLFLGGFPFTGLGGVKAVLIPMTGGMVWNELVDEPAMEKGDFTGHSSAEKAVTVYKAFGDYKPKYETAALEEIFTRTTDAKRESRGPA